MSAPDEIDIPHETPARDRGEYLYSFIAGMSNLRAYACADPA